jgi:hypothetical protein
MEDFDLEAAQRILDELTPEQLLAGIPLEVIENYLQRKLATQAREAPEQSGTSP